MSRLPSLAELASQPMRAPFKVPFAAPPGALYPGFMAAPPQSSLAAVFRAPSLAEAEVLEIGQSMTFIARFSEFLRSASCLEMEVVRELLGVLGDIARSDNAERLRESYLVYELMAYGLSTGFSRSCGSPPAFRPLNCYGRSLNTGIQVDDGRVADFVCKYKDVFHNEINALLIAVLRPPNLLHLLMLSEMFELVLIAHGASVLDSHLDLALALLNKLVLPTLTARETACVKSCLVTLFGAHTPCVTYLSSLLETSPHYEARLNQHDVSPIVEALISSLILMLCNSAEQTLRPRKIKSGAPSLRRAGLRRSLSGPIKGARDRIEKEARAAPDACKRRRLLEELDKNSSMRGFEIIPSEGSLVSSTIADEEAGGPEEYFSNEAPFFSREVSTDPSTLDGPIAFSDIADDRHTDTSQRDSTDAMLGGTAAVNYAGAVLINGVFAHTALSLSTPASQFAHQKRLSAAVLTPKRSAARSALPMFATVLQGLIIVDGEPRSPIIGRHSVSKTRDTDLSTALTSTPLSAGGCVLLDGCVNEQLIERGHSLDSPSATTGTDTAGCVLINGELYEVSYDTDALCSDGASGSSSSSGPAPLWDYNTTAEETYIPSPRALRRRVPLQDRWRCSEDRVAKADAEAARPAAALLDVAVEHGRAWTSETSASSEAESSWGAARRRGVRIRRRRRVRLPKRYRVVNSAVVENLSDLLRRVADACVRVQPPNELLHKFVKNKDIWTALAVVITGGVPRRRLARRQGTRGGTVCGRGPSLQASFNAIQFINSTLKLNDVNSFISQVLPLVCGLLVNLSRPYLVCRKRSKSSLVWTDGAVTSVAEVAKVIDACLWIVYKAMTSTVPIPLHPLMIRTVLSLVVNDVPAILRSRALLIMQMTMIKSPLDLRLAEWVVESDVIFLAAWLFSQSLADRGWSVTGNPARGGAARLAAFRRKTYPSLEPWEHCRAAGLELLATLNAIYESKQPLPACELLSANLRLANPFVLPTAAPAAPPLVREFKPSPLQILAQKR